MARSPDSPTIVWEERRLACWLSEVACVEGHTWMKVEAGADLPALYGGTPAFPEGATVWDAAGQWRAPDGTTVRERGFVVEHLHLVTPDIERRVVAHLVGEPEPGVLLRACTEPRQRGAPR